MAVMKWVALRACAVAVPCLAVVARPAAIGVAACLLLLPRPSSGQTLEIASLEDALRIGFERNLGLQESGKRVQASEAAVGRATWLFLPKATVQVAGARRQAAFDLPPGIAAGLSKDPGFFFGYRGEWFTRLHFEQPLFTGGRNANALGLARLQLDMQRESFDARRLDLQVEIARAYYGVLLAQQVLRIKEDLVAQHRRHREDVTRRFEAGEVARFDQLRAEVQLANFLPDVIRARNAVDVATAQLRAVLDLPRDRPVAVTGSIEYVPEPPGPADPVEEALQQRPELRIRRLNRQASERAVSISHSRWFPAVGAFFTQDYRSDAFGTLFGERHSNWAFGLSFGFTLDVGEALYRGREEQRHVEGGQLAEEQARRNVEVEVTKAVLELKRATEVIESQKQNVRQAEEAMQIANTSYTSGAITNLELMDTQLALDQARINYVTAVYDYLIGRAEYGRVIAREEGPAAGTGQAAARSQRPAAGR